MLKRLTLKGRAAAFILSDLSKMSEMSGLS